MKQLGWIALTMLAVTGAACGEKKEEGQSSTSAPAAALTDKDLPTPSDYDDEAEKQITPANYKTELDSLEKEIAAE